MEGLLKITLKPVRQDGEAEIINSTHSQTRGGDAPRGAVPRRASRAATHVASESEIDVIRWNNNRVSAPRGTLCGPVYK